MKKGKGIKWPWWHRALFIFLFIAIFFGIGLTIGTIVKVIFF